MAEAVEHLLRNQKVLISNPSPTKENQSFKRVVEMDSGDVCML
jgi:hypothetical protein